MKSDVEKRIVKLFKFRTPVKWIESSVIIFFHVYFVFFALTALIKAKLATIAFSEYFYYF